MQGASTPMLIGKTSMIHPAPLTVLRSLRVIDATNSLSANHEPGYSFRSILVLLGTLCPIFRSCLLAVFDGRTIQSSTHNVIANAGKVLDAAPAYENNAVLLQIVAFSANIRDDFLPGGKPYPCHFAQCGIRLLRCFCFDLQTYAAALRTF